MSITSQSKSIRRPNLLVAEDEVEIADIIEAVAEDLGFEVNCVYEGAQVVSLVKKMAPDVIALDLRMPGADGVEIMRELAKINCRSKIVLMSGMDQRTLSSVQNLGREQKLDVIATLAKPMSLDAIEAVFSPHSRPRQEVPEDKPVSKAHAPDSGYGMKSVYQPDVVITDNDTASVPRLTVSLQWRKDDGETLSGPRLGAWAEKLGIGKGMADLLLRDALATWRVWSGRQFSPELGIQLDAFLLRDLEVPDMLAHLTDYYQIDRNKIIVEVEQAAISANSSLVRDILSRLRIKGFKLAVSLEGDGDAFIHMLDRLPIDDVTVDMNTLPADFAVSARSMETEFIYSSLTSLARRKGISVCAINVNRPEQLEFARQCGFARARGSRIGSSLSAEEAMEFYLNAAARKLNG